MHQPLGLGIGDRHGLALAAKEAGDAWLAGNQLPGLVGQLHLDQNISGEKLLLALHADTAAHLDHILDRYHDLFDLMVEAVAFSLFSDQLCNLLLRTGENMQHIPTLCHCQNFPSLQSPGHDRQAVTHQARG